MTRRSPDNFNGPPTAEMPLLEFAARHFVPSGPHRSNHRQQALQLRIANAVKHLRIALRRDPLVSDLCVDVLEQFESHLKKLAEFKDKTVRNLCNSFKALWRYAVALQLVADSPESRAHLKRGIVVRKKNLGPDGEPIRVSDEPGTLWHFCKTEYFPRNLAVVKPGTLKLYEAAFRDLTELLRRPPVLADLNDDTIVMLMRHLKQKGLAATTINERSGRLGALWTWMAKRDRSMPFPTFAKLPEPKRTPRAWTRDDLAKLLTACRAATGWMPNGVRRSVWWTALHLFLWDSGERIGAALALRWEWIDFATGLVSIPAEERKGGDKDATYKLHETTLAWIKALRPIHPELVFGGSITVSSIYGAYKHLRRKAGLPADSKSAFHRMRRSVASHLHAAGHNATDALMHSSAQLTRDAYLDPAIIGGVRPADVLFRPNGHDNLPPPVDPDVATEWL